MTGGAAARTWTSHVCICGGCGWAFHVSAEFIRDMRLDYDEEEALTDQQVAGTAEYCLQCSGGYGAGERLSIRDQVSSAAPLWATEAAAVLTREALVYEAGGNMGGDVDWDGVPVVVGRFYVAGRFDAPRTGNVGLQTVSGPFADSREAVAWAQAQGFPSTFQFSASAWEDVRAD